MIKSGYQEGMYYQEDLPVETSALEGQIRRLLSENHGVGIIGGFYEKGLPMCMVSELTMQMLGYSQPGELLQATGNLFVNLVLDKSFSEAAFAGSTEPENLHFQAKKRTIWVRVVKQNTFTQSRRPMWLASVCDMDDIHQKEQEIQQILEEKQQLEVRRRMELEEANRALKKACDEAKIANAAKSDFLRRMSHDIRTPINGIRGMIDIANHYADDPRKQEECRQKIWEASGYLLSLVNNILDMNKLESGQMEPEEVPFDLRELLKEVDIVAQMQAVEHGLRFRVDKTKTKVIHTRLIGSPVCLKQVLTNLVGNAIKYNREGGSVTVCSWERQIDKDHVEYSFSCADTGIGMSEEFQQRAFEPFAQEGKGEARSNYVGTGLGLTIVKSLVDTMGGSVSFVSREDVGTSFLIRLPFRIDHAEHIRETEAGEQQVLAGRRVLLVEDTEMNLEIARFLLERQGAQVVTARDGREAVETFQTSAPGKLDMILMDIMMPVMNGLEAAKAIRDMDRPDAKTIPIFAMTANAFVDDVAKSRAAGMNEHLSKPLDPDKLLRAMKKYLRG